MEGLLSTGPTPSSIHNIDNFHQIGPLGRFDLVVAMSVCVCVCVCVCVFVCLFVPFHGVYFEAYFTPTSQNRMSKIFRDSESLGKSAGKKWSQNWKFSLGCGLKLPCKKKLVFCSFCLTKHGGNHASRWIRDLWSKGISWILAYV